MSKCPLTIRGAEKLREELKQLKYTARPRIVASIAEARAHGDLRENAEYHAAKEEQAFAEGRIKDIEQKLSDAVIIDVKTVNAGGKVVFGATVDLIDEESGTELSYQVVGEDEASIKEGLISITSPIARALIGRQSGDIATVEAPGGTREYEILAVRYV